MKKALMSLIAASCLSCAGQQVITNYIYEVREYTNNIWTVSNVTIVTHNEITQNVNRVYNYYSTNFTINVETNLYIDTLIGTNIATNVEMTVNVTTNLTLYQTNFIDNVYREVTYHTTYQTNVNTYIDTWQTIYQTNYTTEVTLTNFEGYVEECETIISNGVEYISGMTNYVGDAMLYAYICNEAAQRLASTNAIAFATNSIPLPDPNGYTDRLFQLACNNLNGSFMAKSAGTSGYNIYATAIYAVSWRNVSSTRLTIRMQVSHIAQTDHGFEVVYLPIKEDRMLFTYNNRKYIPSKMTWRYDNASNVLEVLEFDLNGEFLSRHEARCLSTLYPTAYGMNTIDGSSGTSAWTQMSPSITIGGSTMPFYIKCSNINPTRQEVFAPMFPSLDEWRYMWWIENLTGTNMR